MDDTNPFNVFQPPPAPTSDQQLATLVASGDTAATQDFLAKRTADYYEKNPPPMAEAKDISPEESNRIDALNAIRTQPADVLAHQYNNDDTAIIADYRKNQALYDSDPDAKEKFLEAYKIARSQPFSVGSLVVGAASGLYHLPGAVLDSGLQAAKDIGTGEGDKVFQGSVYATVRTGEDLKNAGTNLKRVLGGFVGNGFTTLPQDDKGWQADFDEAIRRDQHLDTVAHGWSSLAQYNDKEAGDIVKNSLVADPMNVVTLVAGGGVNVVLDVARATETGARVFQVINDAHQVIREIPAVSRSGQFFEALTDVAKTRAENAALKTGSVLTKTGESLGEFKGTVIGGAADTVLSHLGHGLPGVGTVTGTIAPKVLKTIGNALTETALKSRGDLPWGGFVKGAQTVAENPTVNAVVKGGFHGLGLAGDPIAATYTAETLLNNADGDGRKMGEAIGSSYGLGAAGGLVAHVMHSGQPAPDVPLRTLNDLQQQAAAVKPGVVGAAPPAKVPTFVKSDPYGVFPEYDKVNAENSAALPPSSRAMINKLREQFRDTGAQIYVLTPDQYAAALADDAQARDGTLSDAGAQALVKSDAATNGVFVPDLQGPDGKPQKVILLNGTGAAGGHEVGHLVDALLTPEDRATVRQIVEKTYSPEEIKVYHDAYEKMLGSPVSREKAVNEIIAENFDKILAGVPPDKLGAPREASAAMEDALRKAYSTPTELGFRASPEVGGHLSKVLAAKKLVTEAPQEPAPAPTPSPVQNPTAAAPVSPAAVPLAAVPVPPEPVAVPVSTPPAAPVAVPPAAPVIQPAAPAPAAPEGAPVLKAVNPKAAENIRVTPAQQDQFATAAVKQRGLAPEGDGEVNARLALQDPRNGYTPENVQVFNDLKTNFGKPVEAEYNSVKSAEFATEREQRRLEQAVPDAEREEAQKIFVPYRTETTAKGKVQVLAMSMDKVIQNVDTLAAELTKRNATDLSPYAIRDGKIPTPEAQSLVRDIQSYLTNQANGYGGNGQRVSVPADYYGSIPAETPGFKPTVLPEQKAQFINALMGADLGPPKTTASPGSRPVPANVSATQLAKVNARPVETSTRGKNPAATFDKFGGGTISELNPLRAQMRKRGVDVEGLHEVTERLSLQDLQSVKPRPDLNYAAGSTDLIRGGFMPKLGNGTARFLYEESYRTRDGQTKTSRYYQTPGDAENPRGLTVEEDTAKAQGYHLEKPVPKDSSGALLSKEGVIKRSAEGDTRQFSPNPNKETQDVARQYVEDHFGRDYVPHDSLAELPEPQLRKIADHFENEAKHDPSNPEVQKSYAALIDETKAQYKAMLAAGIKVEAFSGKGEPYKSSAEMMDDVRNNKHLTFFLTDNGFGSGEEAPNHPLLEKTGIMLDGRELLANDLFRVVHDYFGHTQQGFQFGPKGEYNAWRSHSQMFSPEAQPALAAETLAQNAWVNFGPHLRDATGKIAAKGESGYVPPQERPFAGQKAYVVPQDLIDSVRGQNEPFFERKGDSLNLDRYQAGVTTFKDKASFNLEVFNNALRGVRESIRNLPGMQYARARATEGLYSGTIEPSFDLEFVIDKGANIVPAVQKVIEIGKKADQADVFISRVVAMDHPNSRPGVEIGFKKAESWEFARALAGHMQKSGVDGLTVAVDQRGNPIGLRAQYIPEISARWAEDPETHLDPEKVTLAAVQWGGKARHALETLQASINTKLSYKNETYFDTRVFGREEYSNPPPDLGAASTLSDELGRRRQALGN